MDSVGLYNIIGNLIKWIVFLKESVRLYRKLIY